MSAGFCGTGGGPVTLVDFLKLGLSSTMIGCRESSEEEARST